MVFAMSSRVQQLKRSQDNKSLQLTAAQKQLPTGNVTTPPDLVKGEYNSLPMLGWVSKREDRIPLVTLALMLTDDEDQLKGILQVEFPIYIETEGPTVALLEQYGWNGLTWGPGDEHWPTGDDINEDQLATLVVDAGLSKSFVFPEAKSQRIEVTRATGNFLMAPLPAAKYSPELVEDLQRIVKGYRDFFPGAVEELENEQKARNEALH